MVELTLRQMEYIVALHDKGHFGEAARSCHISQPALSRQVKKVEDLLGTRLFERTPDGTIATPAGREFVTEARQILDASRHLIDRVASVGGQLQGPLRLGVIPTVGPYLLPEVLSDINAAFPDLELTLIESQTSRLLQDLKRRRIDVALMASPVESTGADCLAVARDPFAAIVPRDHPLADTDRLSASDLMNAPLLLLEEGHCFRDHALEFCAQHDSVTEANIQATSLSTLLSLVELGHGLTIVPALALTRELLGRSRLRLVPFRSPIPSRDLSLFWRHSSPRQEAYHRLATHLVNHLPSINRSLIEQFDDPSLQLKSLISTES